MSQVTYLSLIGYYELLKTIGNGGFDKVKQAIHLLTGEFVAIKIVDKAKLGSDLARIAPELKAMKDLRHQHMYQLYQVIEKNEYYFLVLEYFCNGELFDYIINRNHLSKEQARYFFRQIVSTVAYMHKKGYCHRDLKPGDINLVYLGTACGSPAYAAPEILAETNYRGDVNVIYHISSYLSQESVALLRLMLQIDPTKRIRIDDLLCHSLLINHVYTEPAK
ncbi:unnamed protein product [Rotaria sp. Silwood1]|nr:unnamed protein product [Rotaria sp. Silwood1]CAF0998803.1 unnamed protein product [Rotaria sp. Silwood1]CAF3407427.1 unnamed protein product [Rotaria sp. Silwood1]CAF4748032.1 unnamed protein product [Rotaria sp. Silwood1]